MNGAVVRELTPHQCALGSISARCSMWVEFGVGSRLAPRIFYHLLLTATKDWNLLQGDTR